MKKLVVEIALTTKLKPDELLSVASLFQWTIAKALSTVLVGGLRVHDPDHLRVRVEQDDEAPLVRAGRTP